MTRNESLNPAVTKLADVSAESDTTAAPLGTLTAALPTDAEAIPEEEGAATAQPPRTARGRGEPHRTPLTPRAAKPSAPLPKTAPHSGKQEQPARSAGMPLDAGIADAPIANAPTAAWAAPEANQPIAQEFSPGPGASELGPSELGASEEEDFPHPPSRLSGLRNMLVSLGRRSLIQEGMGEEESEFEPRFERASMRPAYAEASALEAEPAAAGSADSSPVRVTAPPEFLRPKVVPEVEKEKEPLRATPPLPRRDTRDPEEVQTLPSWRGQYRKKRYPPI